MTDDAHKKTEAAVERRRDEALRRALNTPPQPKVIAERENVTPGLSGRKTPRSRTPTRDNDR